VIQYAISGLAISPSPIWLDGDGAFFAQVGSWFAVVREGWESTIDTLRAAQEVVDAARLAAIARDVAHRPPGPLVFEHARLFDAEQAQMLPGRTVVITGERITAVGDDGRVVIPSGAERVDASGKTLLPGLWDMHVHLGADDGVLHMACGVTTVRDLGNDIEQLADLRRKYDTGVEVGPRVLMAGFLDGRGPYAGPTKVFADSMPEAEAAIARYASLGYPQLKIYSSIQPGLVPGIIAAAHRRGMRVSGHVPAFMTAEQFVRAGADEIQHMNFLFLNFLSDSVPDTRTPARFTAVARLGADIDPSAEPVRKFIGLLRERRTVVDPTLGIFENLFTDRPRQVGEGFAVVADRLPVQIRRGLSYGGLEVPEGQDRRYRQSFHRMLEMTKALYDAGVPLVAGTDGFAGFALQRELELDVAAGIPAPAVLQLATLGAARVMKRDSELGSIAPGKLADLILIDGDPATRIGDIRRVETVIKGGVMYPTSKLCEAVGIRPWRR
jgi:imidazolonepropionase-like amidohydrolase